MRGYVVPGVLLLGAALVVGCQDTSTSPNMNLLEMEPLQVLTDNEIDRNGDGRTCVNIKARSLQRIDNSLPDADGDGFGDCPPSFGEVGPK